MKRLRNAPLLLFACYLLIGCNYSHTKNGTTIKQVNIDKLESSPVYLTSITDSMEIVPLENRDSALVASITQIKIAGDTLFMTDMFMKGIFVFHKSGKLIKNLECKGNGPGEYTSMSDFLIDRDKRMLEIFDNAQCKIHRYRLSDFSFIESIAIPPSLRTSFRFAKQNDNYYLGTYGLCTHLSEDKSTSSEVLLFEVSTGKVIPLFDADCRPADPKGNRTMSQMAFTTDLQGNVYASIGYQNQLFQLSNRQVKTIIDFNVEIPGNLRHGSYEEQEAYLNKATSKGMYSSLLLQYYNGNDFIVVGIQGNKPPKGYHYLNIQGKEYLTDQFMNDYLPHPQEMPCSIVADYVVSIIYPGVDKTPAAQHYIESLHASSEDNPILLLSKLKQ
ncbi:MAG: 6-bladed beta-propeller [Prevotellaceae bacterium]|jgi:hypothetical protein|nr:6-bladed beta-propeller [Prevotellaceae bacterium]